MKIIYYNYFLIVTLALFYFFEGILINPFILWTAAPLFIGYLVVRSELGAQKTPYQGNGFILFAAGFSYFYHLAWYFDWGGTKTGGSTSALIFIWFPIYAVVLGLIGLLLGYCIALVKQRK